MTLTPELAQAREQVQREIASNLLSNSLELVLSREQQLELAVFVVGREVERAIFDLTGLLAHAKDGQSKQKAMDRAMSHLCLAKEKLRSVS